MIRAAIILDALTLLLSLPIGFFTAIGAGMARVGPLGRRALPPMTQAEGNWNVAQTVGVAALAVLPSIVFMWLGYARTSLVLAIVPLVPCLVMVTLLSRAAL